MYKLPTDILNIIVDYCDIYSISQLSKTNKDFYNLYSTKNHLINNPTNKFNLMLENKDGIGIGGNSLNIAHKDNPAYWKKKEYICPWEFRWKLNYIWWFDINYSTNLQPGIYEISGILWNIYESLIGNIVISNDYEQFKISKKFIPYENLNSFPNYKNRYFEIDNIIELNDGQITDITSNSNSEIPINSMVFRKYKYSLGIIDIKFPSKVDISLYNKCCKYHKDNIIFECFRIKKLG